MHTRKEFLRRSGGLLAGSALLSNSLFASLLRQQNSHAVGLQLFTLFNTIDDDVMGSLKNVAALGYTEIESAFSKKGGYYGMTPKQFAAAIKDLGMKWTSHHVIGAPFKLPPGTKLPAGADGKPMTIPPMKNLRDNMQEMVDQAAEGGVEYLVCANTPIGTLDEIKQSIETLVKTGDACKKSGIGFAYHNHDAEFHAVEGKIPYDLILHGTPADTVKMELDLAWATKGGKDPVELFKQNPGRFPQWHVKDLDATMQNILPVGSGVVDYKKIFANAEVAGMKHFYVEHDFPKDAWDSMTKSIDYIKNKL